MGSRTARTLAAVACITAAIGTAACGSSGGGSTDAAAPDPLTATVPPSTISADTPVEPGVFTLVGEPSLALDLVRSGASLGFVGREGLSMRMRAVASDDDVLAALRSGTADAAVVSSDDALALAAQGARFRIVLLLTTVTSGQAIVADADVADVPALVGHRVTYASGTQGELLLRGMLAAQDVPITEVELVRTGGREPGALLLEGSADAAVTTGAAALATQEADPSVVPIATAGDLPGLLSHVVIVREETAATHPGQVLALIRSWQDLYLSERDDPELVAAGIAVRNREPVAEVAADLGGNSLYDVSANAVDLLPGGEYYDRTLTQIDAAATAAGWLSAPVDARALIDGSFAQAVASAR